VDYGTAEFGASVTVTDRQTDGEVSRARVGMDGALTLLLERHDMHPASSLAEWIIALSTTSKR